jgi:transcriptional regulator with XRE-family HTH domain
MTTVLEFPADQYVRRVRRMVDASQRELADVSGVSERTVARIESRRCAPSLRVLCRLLAAAGFRLAVVDGTGQLVREMQDLPDDPRDCQDRRYPAHLDVIVDPQWGDWWADLLGLARPPETFHRDRTKRDRQRDRYIADQQLYGRCTGVTPRYKNTRASPRGPARTAGPQRVIRSPATGGPPTVPP